MAIIAILTIPYIYDKFLTSSLKKQLKEVKMNKHNEKIIAQNNNIFSIFEKPPETEITVNDLSYNPICIGDNIYCRRAKIIAVNPRSCVDRFEQNLTDSQILFSENDFPNSDFDCVIAEFKNGSKFNDVEDFLNNNPIGHQLKPSLPIHAVLTALNFSFNYKTVFQSTKPINYNNKKAVLQAYTIKTYHEKICSCHAYYVDSEIPKPIDTTKFQIFFVFLIK